MSGQWNSSMSASVDMSSNVSFNGQSINQQQRVSADMRSYSSKAKFVFATAHSCGIE